jgi:hypothetical protein
MKVDIYLQHETRSALQIPESDLAQSDRWFAQKICSCLGISFNSPAPNGKERMFVCAMSLG